MKKIEFSFKDKRSETIHDKLLEKNGMRFSEYFNQLIDMPFDYGNNNIPENTTFSLDCLQITEIYTRNSKERLRKLFYSIFKASKKDKVHHSSNKEEIEKCINSLSKGDFQFFVTWFQHLSIEFKSKYIKKIELSLTAIGPSLFRIVFNCYPTDSVRYRYWQYATPNVKREIGFKRNILRTKLKVHRLASMQRKKQELNKIESKYYKSAYTILKRIAPGVFCNTLKELPSTLLLSYEQINYVFLIHNVKFYSKREITNFYNCVIDSDANHSRRYIDSIYGNIFIPPPESGNVFNSIFMKHIRTGVYISPTQQISWLSILFSLLKAQHKKILSIRNIYYDIDINNKYQRLSKYKKNINRGESIWSLLKSSYDREKKDYIDRFDKTIDYIYSFDDYSISYYQEYIDKIDNVLADIEIQMAGLKELYKDRYEEQSARTNLNLQIFALILAIFTIGQTLYQCSNNQSIIKETEKTESIKIEHPTTAST